jgi:hypothetical protein
LGAIHFLESGSDEESARKTNPNGDERQSDMTVIPAVVLAEDYRIAEEEGVLLV